MKREITYRSLKEAGVEMPKDIQAGSRKLVETFHRLVHKELLETCEQNTPVGDDAAASKRADRYGKYYGHMKDRWVTVVGDRKIEQKGAGLKAIRYGKNSRVANDAAHARVIEMGWQLASYTIKTKTGDSADVERMVGSPQAPNGIAGPAVAGMEAKVERLKREAIEKVERSSKK